MDFAAATRAALDHVLVREGFAAGQGDGTQVIYCANHDDISDRFPRLPQASAQPRGRGCCIDLVIDQQNSGLQLHLEGERLSDTLQTLGLDDAAEVVDATGTIPWAEALASLVDILPQTFRSSEA